MLRVAEAPEPQQDDGGGRRPSRGPLVLPMLSIEAVQAMQDSNKDFTVSGSMIHRIPEVLDGAAGFDPEKKQV